MKPFMMKFRYVRGEYEHDVYVNMNQVCYIVPLDAGSVLVFAANAGGECLEYRVNETPDEIAARPEWRQ